MNVDISTVNISKSTSNTNKTGSLSDSAVTFKEELSELEKNTTEKLEDSSNLEQKEVQDITNVDDSNDVLKDEEQISNNTKMEESHDFVSKNKDKENKIDTAESQVEQAFNGLHMIVEEVNIFTQEQSKVKAQDKILLQDIENNKTNLNDDIEKDNVLINNEVNFPEPFKPNLESGMNFNGNGQQPFSTFVQNQETKNLRVTEKELQEEQAILSTMEENIALVNRANINKQNISAKIETGELKIEKNKIESVYVPENKSREVKLQKNNAQENQLQEVKLQKINAQENQLQDMMVKADAIIMSKEDVEFFANLVNNVEIDVESVQKSKNSAQVSKTLADLIAKAMNENKPVRVDFDNDISVIIRITREGKISAEFLPSSQIAEAYLKENLPLLRQRFDDNNIEYDDLSQRKQRQNDKEEKKKGRENE